MRRCWLLIEHLPADSALVRAAAPDAAQWSLTNHLLAVAVDALQAANWQRSGNDKAPRPEPVQRPGVQTPAHVTESRARAFLERQRLREGGD